MQFKRRLPARKSDLLRQEADRDSNELVEDVVEPQRIQFDVPVRSTRIDSISN